MWRKVTDEVIVNYIFYVIAVIKVEKERIKIGGKSNRYNSQQEQEGMIVTEKRAFILLYGLVGLIATHSLQIYLNLKWHNCREVVLFFRKHQLFEQRSDNGLNYAEH